MQSKIAIRAYTEENPKRFKRDVQENNQDFDRLLIFDTETTNDEFQNLKFGSFMVVQHSQEALLGMFYHKNNLVKGELEIIRKYCNKNNINLFDVGDFIDNIFYPEMLEAKSLCIGFNLPFDLSRLAIHFSEGRHTHKGDWFSIQLSPNKFLPRLKIKSIDSAMSFIQFSKKFKGHFLDLRTPSVIFTDDKHASLESSGKFFQCQTIKQKAKEHGIVNEEYLDYNINDLLATYNLYQNIVKHFDKFQIKANLNKIYSNASLGKSALKQMGIQPLSKISTKINAKVKGQLMSAYFGGRCETKIRKTPVEVSVLDFLSMYPSLTINMGLWDYVISKEIQEKDMTKETIEFLNRINLTTLINKEIWKLMNILVELEPNEDILPIRSNYLHKGDVYNVGINYLNYGKSLYYALPDVIASVLLTGKIPKVKRAIGFIPVGKQETLKKTNILDIEVNPSEQNFIKILIEKRHEYKELRDKHQKGSDDYNRFDGMQRALKILANSLTYGIFIELRTKQKDTDLIVYSKEQFFAKQKVEEEGKFFNPLIAVMQVAGARLLLAMAEKYLQDKNTSHIYMDTDACYAPSKYAHGLREFFKPLNPYSFNEDFFKIEKEKYLFYGISAKRYVLYRLENNKIVIEKDNFKLHGLGYLLNPFDKKFESGEKWHKEVWEDILKLHYNLINQEDVINKYSNLFSISKIAVSTPFLYKRFREYNKYKLISKQIKPFNFFLVGQRNYKDIKPIAPYSYDSQLAVHEKFIDYKSGQTFEGLHYWKNLADTILEYANHPESKFINGSQSGKLERRHINEAELIFIGKEVKNLEQLPLLLDKPLEYKSEKEKINKILRLSFKDAKGYKVSKSTLWEMKERLKKDPTNFNWKTKAVKKLLR